MPNPLDRIAGGWALTWGLQVMPLFFVIGGFANTAAWHAAQRDGRTHGAFIAGRMRRLARPTAGFIGVWLLVEGFRAVVGLGPDTPVWHWGVVVFVPLWFVAVYGATCAVSPWLVDHARRLSWPALAAVVVLADVGRLLLGIGALGVVSTIGVWLACHQLGVWWRIADLGTTTPRRKWGIVATGLVGLIACTTVGGYPASMVARPGDHRSNLLPTALPVVFVGVLQLGLALIAQPRLNRWMQHRRAWRVVIAANGVAMTVLTWHMTAFVVAATVWSTLGGRLGMHADTRWWLQRPLWLIGPSLVLIPIVALMSGLERPRTEA